MNARFTHVLSATQASLIVTLFVSALTHISYGQSKPEILTNQTVVSLVKAGLDKSIIITTINNADGKFDVSTQGLLNLKKLGVPNEVIMVMVEKESAPVQTSHQIAAQSNGRARLKVELINHPYALNAAGNTVSALEKNTANIATRMKALGYGGVTSQYEISGIKAAIRKPASDSLTFVVNTGGGAPEFVLYKTKVTKDKWVAASLKVGPTSGAKSGNNTISFNVFPESNGVFKLVPLQKLEPGEYFFAGKPVVSANSIDVYSFGIDR
jgi:hypothetical protein